MILMKRLFDAHFHVIDPRFPLVPNQGYLPDRYTVNDYLERLQDYELCGGAIISGSFQAFDQDYLIDALARLGPGYVGVSQLPATTPDQEILDLDRAGVRGVRFNLKRGGSEDISELDRLPSLSGVQSFRLGMLTARLISSIYFRKPRPPCLAEPARTTVRSQ